MRAYNLLLLSIVLLASQLMMVAANTRRYISPDCSNYDDETLLADHQSCSHYYLCYNGHALRRHCARGLRYDTRLQLCNFPMLVDCRLNYGQFTETSTIVPTVHATQTVACVTTPAPCPPTTTPPCAPTTPCPPTTPPCAPTTPCPPETPKPATPCPPATPKPATPCPPPTPCPPTTPCPPPTPCPPTTPCPPPQPTPCPTPKSSTVTPGAQILHNRNDCLNYDDGTFLLDPLHCKRYYVCNQGRAQRLRCKGNQWFDYEFKSCRNRRYVTNCPANAN